MPLFETVEMAHRVLLFERPIFKEDASLKNIPFPKMDAPFENATPLTLVALRPPQIPKYVTAPQLQPPQYNLRSPQPRAATGAIQQSRDRNQHNTNTQQSK